MLDSNWPRFSEIRHEQPAVPADGDDMPHQDRRKREDLRPTFAPGHESMSPGEECVSPSADTGVVITAAFEAVVRRLVDLHAAEVAAAAAVSSSKAELTERNMEVMLQTVPTKDMERLTSVDSSISQSSKRRQTPSRSAQKGTSSENTTGYYRPSPSTADVLCRKKEGLQIVHASRILDALSEDSDDAPGSPASFAEDMKALFAANTHASQASLIEATKSERMRRFEKMKLVERVRLFLTSTKYEILMALILFLNVSWMAFELQVTGSYQGVALGMSGHFIFDEESRLQSEGILRVGDYIFTTIFALDVAIRIFVLQRKFWKLCINYIDLAVSVATLLEWALISYANEFPINPLIFRLLRLGKLARAIRMVTMTSVLSSLQLLLKCLAASRAMLFWSFCLLTFVQWVAGLVLSALCYDFIKDETNDPILRKEVYRYYGTFTRTTLSMFEIMFANWAPPCRVLVDSVSEYFAGFFLVYRCILGFSILNVVNAVFVQQTMKTASSDEELAFKQKEKDIAAYARKVKRLFLTMDSSGDGALSMEEFSKLVQSPKLKFWMSQLELEYHDLLSLFEFLDNGDGQITLSEFIEGASRLRGNAKALDIWRIETKVEVLFEECLTLLYRISPELAVDTRAINIQDIFDNSAFRHIQSTAQSRVKPDRSQGDESP